MSPGEWIAAVGILVALIEPILISLAHKRKNAERQGFMDAQFQELTRRVDKSFDYHKEHFAHSTRTEIHQRSMDEQLINSKFENTDQKIEALGELVGTKMDNLSQRIIDLADIVQAKNP